MGYAMDIMHNKCHKQINVKILFSIFLQKFTHFKITAYMVYENTASTKYIQFLKSYKSRKEIFLQITCTYRTKFQNKIFVVYK